MEQPITLMSGVEMLVADVHAGSREAVIFLAGWGGTRYGPQRILLRAATALAAKGYTTLRLDFRGRGDSTGFSQATTLDGMIEDTCTAIAWLRTEQHIERVNLVGLCSGGNVALGTASLHPELVNHVVCWSLLPFMEHKAQAAKQGTNRFGLLQHLLRKAMRPEAWRKLLRGEANVQGAVKVLVKDKEGDAVERERKTSRRDILGDLSTFTGKLHLLYGSRDPESAGSQAFFTTWCRKHRIPVDTRVIQGAPHNFYTAGWTRDVIQQTAQWISGTE